MTTTTDDTIQRIDELCKLAGRRMDEASPILVSVMGGAGMDFLTPAERAELHALKMQLPTFAEEREAARQRLALRIARRRQ